MSIYIQMTYVTQIREEDLLGISENYMNSLLKLDFTYKNVETVTSLNVSDRIVLSSSEDKELKDNNEH